MFGVEDELWSIFTYYSLHSNPTDPSHLDGPHFYKLCSDSNMVLKQHTRNPILNELKMVCTSEVRKFSQKSHRKGLLFDDFISCLATMSTRCYPECQGVEDSFLHLLLDNVLPFAKRRFPVSIRDLLLEASLESLVVYYETAFLEIFKYYFISGEDERKDKRMSNASIQAPRHSNSEPLKQPDKRKSVNLKGTVSSNASVSSGSTAISGSPTTGMRMRYGDFLRFAADYGLVSRLHLSTMELGDIFLNNAGTPEALSLSSPAADSDADIDPLPSLRFSKFVEALVMCALTAFHEYPKVSPASKLQAMLQVLCKRVEEVTVQALHGRWLGSAHNKSSDRTGAMHAGDHLKGHGAQLLHDKFISSWERDSFRDYLATESESATVGRDLLRSLSTSSAQTQETTTGLRREGTSTGDGVEEASSATLTNLRALLQQKPDTNGLLQGALEECGLARRVDLAQHLHEILF